MRDSYCCFLCPTDDYSEHDLADRCPTCNNSYGFPIDNPPGDFGGFRNVQKLGRGFYAATYVAEFGPFSTTKVLKVAARSVYAYFKKDFTAECRKHKEIAADSEHIVDIENMFDEELSFGGITIACHVAVLEYAKGPLLADLLWGHIPVPTLRAAQIATDMFRLLRELENRGVNHNDLHAKNLVIKELSPAARRAEALDGGMILVALDLGSLSDGTKSSEQRLGDVHWVGRHLMALVDRVLQNAATSSDLDFRLAAALTDRAQGLAPAGTSARTHSWDDYIEEIRSAVRLVSKPWSETLRLQRFNDAYNAQTLAPWFVPLLLVDPDGNWLARISTPGPQIITGMRGCGKTMLLRALQFHARAAKRPGEAVADVLRRITDDRFMGLYISVNRLLDQPGSADPSGDPYARLFVAYALQAVQAVLHLQDVELDARTIEPNALVDNTFHHRIGRAVASFVSEADALCVVESASELERRLLELSVSTLKPSNPHTLTGTPQAAFSHLSSAIARCSRVWASARVLYLLDDISTRYLNDSRVREVLGALMFSDDSCAFKITTEAQTMEIALQQPTGRPEVARPGRDYDTFDLGADVHRRLRARQGGGGGKAFLHEILTQRSAYFPAHPPTLTPEQLLGDATLESIAERIVSTGKTAAAKKSFYHGISALAAVCVGDIGDVISIYERILSRRDGDGPVSAEKQTEAYGEFCNRRLYHLNRLDNALKDFALTFAEASYELLMRSARESKPGDPHRRLRQYLKIYVRITTGDPKWQFERLRQLIDNGIFVLTGGSDTPRTKTKDSDPIHQFVLTYRKLFGLSNFIGLSERDRFELSGDALQEWLQQPARGKEVLMRHLAVPDSDDDTAVVNEQATVLRESVMPINSRPTDGQLALFASLPEHDSNRDAADAPPAFPVVNFREVELSDVAGADSLIVGAGFEDRAPASLRRVLEHSAPTRIAVLTYSGEFSHGKNVDAVMDQVARTQAAIETFTAVTENLTALSARRIVVDVSALTTPAIFQVIIAAIGRGAQVTVVHTRAETYYPRDAEIGPILEADRTQNHYALLETLSSVMTAESAPYSLMPLLGEIVEPSRRRVLIAFASAKHERLLTLLEERAYDAVEIVAPDGNTARGELARMAAQVAVDRVSTGRVARFGSYELARTYDHLTSKYQSFYVHGGFNVELGLTGSKLQTVACAALTTTTKIAQCWYVRPFTYRQKTFTQGVGTTRAFRISRS